MFLLIETALKVLISLAGKQKVYLFFASDIEFNLLLVVNLATFQPLFTVCYEFGFVNDWWH